MADTTIGEGRARERTFREEWQQGYQEGYRKGILPGIALVIEERFGAAGLALMEEIQTLTAVEQLRMLGKRLLTATNLDEVRAVYRTDGVEDTSLLTWIEVANGASYVRATLAIEAPEILDLLTPTERWECVELPIELVQDDPATLAKHAADLSHQRRLEECLERIHLGRPLLPLILLRCERGARYLVDGYTRYRGAQQLGARSVAVLRQR